MFRKLHNGKRAGGDAWHSAVAGDRATTRFLYAALATSCLLAVSGCRQQAAENVVADTDPTTLQITSGLLASVPAVKAWTVDMSAAR